MQKVGEYFNGITVMYSAPDMTDEEREEKKKELLLKLYKALSNNNKYNLYNRKQGG